MKRIKMVSTAILMAIFILGQIIGPSAVTTTVNAATISISKKNITLEVGTSQTLKMIGTTKKPTWASSKSSVATVTSSGKVTAKAAGTTYITAKVSGKKYTCKVTVVPAVKLSYKSYTLEVGRIKLLKVSGTTSKPVWTSSNKAVATVSSFGTIKGIKVGTATITATVNGKKLTCLVTVKAPIKISDSSYNMETGNTHILRVSGSKSKITWTSSNTSVATVAANGEVTALAPGNATITAAVDGKVLTCYLNITAPKDTMLENAPYKAVKYEGDTFQVVAPKEWKYSLNVFDSATYINLTPNTIPGSNVTISLFHIGENNYDYTMTKEIFSQRMTQEKVYQQYVDIYGQIGNTDVSVSDFYTEDFQADHGLVFKTEYKLSVNGVTTNQIVYNYYDGEYYVEVNTTDADGTLEAVSDYIVYSLKTK